MAVLDAAEQARRPLSGDADTGETGDRTPGTPGTPGTRGTLGTGDGPRQARGFRLVLLAGLLALTLACGGVGLWLTAQRGSAADVQRDREEVMSASGQFLLRMGTYGPDLLDGQGAMPDYRSRVREVITPKFAASFDEQAGAAEQLVAQSGMARDAQVFATGVSTLDRDSATALVAGSFTDSYTVKGELQPQEPVPFRMEVTLVKVDGEWLVDDFEPVTGEAR